MKSVARDGAAVPAEWIEQRERGSRTLLRIMTRTSLRLGRRPSRSILYLITLYFFFFAPAARRHSRHFLQRVLDRRVRERDWFRHVLTFATTIHDRCFLLNGRYELFDVTVEGAEHMQAALDSGAGAFLMGAHLGSFEVLRALGSRQPGLSVAMAMYEENARKVNDALGAINPDAMPEVIALGHMDAMLRIAERLDRGVFVGVLADRSLGGEPANALEFLGSTAHFPTGAMRAAALLGRKVIFMLGLYRGANRYHIIFTPLADFTHVSPRERESAVRAAVEQYARRLETYCRSDPFNWFNFYDFWSRGGTAR
jgi:predicted LPLAT superfamily acyltransferase